MQKFTPEDRNLRLIILLGFLPACSLLLAHGITTAQLFPALGVAPMALSSLSALVIVAKRVPPSRLLALFDFGTASALIAVLVPSFVALAERSSHHWRGNGIAPVTMLGAYGTVPLMNNLCIHAYFTLRSLFQSSDSVDSIRRGSQQTIRDRDSMASPNLIGERYDDGDDEACRESSEIETTPRASEETLARSSASLETERLL